jgi:hypothetical protein
MFKVYSADETDHEIVLARTPYQAALIARTVFAEAETPRHHVKVVELALPETGLGLVYEPNTKPIEYPKGKKKG